MGVCKEETGEERPASPRHETLGEVDEGDVKEIDIYIVVT